MLLSTYFERRLNKNVDKNLCAKISFSLLLVRKLSLVNETPEARDRDETVWLSVRDETETETFPHFTETETRPRLWENASRDRLETERSRPRLHPCFKLQQWDRYHIIVTVCNGGLMARTCQMSSQPLQLKVISTQHGIFRKVAWPIFCFCICSTNVKVK